MNEPQKVSEYLGYSIYFEGISVSCPALKLRGYRDELDLARAMYRLLKRKGTLPADAVKPTKWYDDIDTLKED